MIRQYKYRRSSVMPHAHTAKVQPLLRIRENHASFPPWTALTDKAHQRKLAVDAVYEEYWS